jgi:hypothetical protein
MTQAFKDRAERLEQALREAYRHPPEPGPFNVGAALDRIRLLPRPRRSAGDTAFLWKFLVAAGVAALFLFSVSVWNGGLPESAVDSQAFSDPVETLLVSAVSH